MPERALNTKQLCSCVLYNNFDLYAKNPTSHLSHDERLGSNLPNIPTLCLMLLQFLSSAADGHKINAAEYSTTAQPLTRLKWSIPKQMVTMHDTIGWI